MAVNTERVQLLYDDLKNGNHDQAHGMLERVNADGSRSYCCLGRAMHVAMDNGLDTVRTVDDPIERMVTFLDSANNIQQSILLDNVRDWYGFDFSNPEVKYDGRTVSLAELNDGCVKFSHVLSPLELTEIAEVIKENFLTGEE